MTLRQFEYVIAVAEEGSFTLAARRLRVSQPALSHQVRALERQVGGELFTRPPGPVRPTPLGEVFVTHARTATAAAREAARAAGRVARLEAGELRLATLHSIALGIVPAAIRRWRSGHPGMRIRVHEYAHTDRLAADMAQGVADVAVGMGPTGWDGPLWPLGCEEMLVVLPRDDELLGTGRRSVRLTRLAGRPWVLYSPDYGLASLVAEACARAGFAPRAAVRTHHAVTAAELAVAGLGPALVPENVVGAELAGAVLRPDPPVRREVVAFTRPRPAPVVAAFVDVLVEHSVL